MKYLIITLLLAFARAENDQHLIPIGRLNDIADHVNNHPESTWQASKFDVTEGKEQFVDTKLRVGVLEGSAPKEAYEALDATANQCTDNGLPKEFDARKKWSQCESVIGHIYDQGNCGSCWAVSTASAFSDRVCIATKGKKKALFASQQILSCCHKCAGPDGCNGGWPIGAFAYMKHTGLVTGGDYGSRQGCQPYLMQQCNHHIKGSLPECSSLEKQKTPKCKLHCYNFKHDKTFKQDRIRAEKYYSVLPCAAQNEIYQNGPIIATFTVFEDFYTYKSGVYQHVTGARTGRHAVKVIGWGEEKGVPYWLVANSWNTNWGDNGIFKIKRGEDEGWFEEEFAAVKPKV